MNQLRTIQLLLLSLCSQFAVAQDANLERGKAIYFEQCASCHGNVGEGIASKYPDPLTGDKSVGELSKYIDESMPEGAPEKCVGNDARDVAAYISETFYSEIARFRNQPPRVSLARLTHRQFEESVADLLVPFRGEGKWSDDRGLNGDYRLKDWKEAFKRVDTVIDFHFGQATPDPQKIDTDEYIIQWSGGVLAEETGFYEFTLESTNGVRLWVNDLETPIIDAAVKSGNDTEYHSSTKLLGGRVYPIRIEFKRTKGEEGNVRLLWKPPHQTRQLVPARNLSPGWFPKSIVLQTPLPPDDSSFGYERGTSLSKEWDLASTQAAVEVADKILLDLNQIAGVQEKDDLATQSTKRRAAIEKLVPRIVCHPLNEQEKASMVDKYWNAGLSESEAMHRILVRALKSPDFLYPSGVAANESRLKAQRLALILWDSRPDQELMNSVEAGQLVTPDQLRYHAKRMMANPRGLAKLKYFLRHWMQLERADDVSKDDQLFPGFSKELLSDLRISLELFVDDILRSDGSDFRQLLQADSLFVNGRIGEYYGIAATDPNAFQKVSVDGNQRAGILTHPFLMAGFAYHKSSSPIHRGVFLAKNVLGRTLRTPPIAVAPLDEGSNPSLTTRERVLLQTKPDACQSCHTLINPLGFSLEHYDAVGRFREQEKDKPIDATGRYIATSGEQFQFNGARELANFLAAHHDTHESFVEHLFHHSVQQPIFAFGQDRLSTLVDRFMAVNFNIRELMIEIAIAGATP